MFIGILSFLIWSSGFFIMEFMLSYSLIGAYYSFITAHDAAHRIVSPWLGRMACVPLGIPFDDFAILHRRHHQYTNCPNRDPDYIMQTLTPLHWLFAPEIYVTYYLRKSSDLPRSTQCFGAFRYLLVIFVYILSTITIGFRWTFTHLIFPTRLAFMLLVYLLDVLPHRNLAQMETRDLWNEDQAPFWLRVLTQNQCYHERHHKKPHIRTIDLHTMTSTT